MIALASTGNDNNSNTAVTTMAHPNNTNLCKFIPGVLIFNIVVIKLLAPNKLLIPDKCKANIAKSTLGPLWLCAPDSGGYKVQPVPAPFSIPPENKNSAKLGISNQKLMLFSLGYAISGPPTTKGSRKLPNPPIIAGIRFTHNLSKMNGLYLYLRSN